MAKVIQVLSTGKQQLLEINVSQANVVIEDVPCNSSVYVGAVVRMSSGTAINAIADSVINSNMIGVCESKSSSVLCNVRVLGISLAIFSGLDETKEYFLSDTVEGGITTTIPTTSGHVVLKIGQPYSTTEMLILKGQRSVRA